MDFHKLLKVAINASVRGGDAIMEIYATDFAVEHKDDKSPLTLADKNCNDVIEEYLLNTNIPILSEEGAKMSFQERKKWKYFWLVDPLDGTKEFVKRNGEFTVNIAMIHEGNPIMGVIYVPVKKELYFALEGLGSFKTLNFTGEITDLEKLISVSDTLPIKQERDTYIIVGSRSHLSAETEKFFNEKRKENDKVDVLAVGSSLKLCMVAEGKADAYPRYAPTMEWDTGAGDAICRMAGFQVLQYNTENPVEYNKENLLNPWFLVK
ncbi:3'(2'),5'-bisphosphate nucleotidase CysQ [Flavobacteriales bacterium]|nr:3'(2'),5'-bisphosphate nucleotidase CysQ [Flavobacteriales bacterium]